MGLKSLSRETLPGPKTRYANIEGLFVVPSSPSMSEGHQAKISQHSRRNSMSALSYAGSRFTAIEVILFGSVGWTWIFFES
jgi:hypothetical protein